MTKILIVLTSHDTLGDTGKSTGFHFEEFATPYYVFKEAGFTVDVASVQGGKPPYDPSSLPNEEAERPESVKRFLADKEAIKQLESTMAVHEVNQQQYDAMYLPGGHGTMWDLPESEALADIVSEMFAEHKPIGAVCHGPAGLVSAKSQANGEPVVRQANINCFTNREECMIEMEEEMPFLLESRLRELGCYFQAGKPFEEFVVQDGVFFTGQNPASCKKLAELMVKALKKGKAEAA